MPSSKRRKKEDVDPIVELLKSEVVKIQNSKIENSKDETSKDETSKDDNVGTDFIPHEDVCRVKQDIFFYHDIKGKHMRSLLFILHTLPDKSTYFLHLCSSGGNVAYALGMHDIIKNKNITGIVEGSCQSSGTLLLMACKCRKMTRNSFLMLHELRSAMDELSVTRMGRVYENCQLALERMKLIYLERSNLTLKELKCLMENETEIYADDCLQYGLIDEII
jgi:ATP-dependent protease ClpP protease subunit